MPIPAQVGQYLGCRNSERVSLDWFTTLTLAGFQEPGKQIDCAKIRPAETITSMNIPRFDNARILTIGDAMVDRYWHGETTRVSAEAPIPVVDVSDIEDRPGGAANVALNVATLGAGSSLIAATGTDEMALILRGKLESSGIDCEFVEIENWSTITKVRLVSRNQQMLRADFEQTVEVRADEVIARLNSQSDCDGVILSDYDKGLFTDPAAVIAAARDRSLPVYVDPKFKSFEAYSGATIIKPNAMELRHAIGDWQCEAEMVSKSREMMLRIGCEAFLVTRAAEGMTLIPRDAEESHFPAKTREVYDTSGAGDTVIATLAAALGAGRTMTDAVALANIAAGIVVSYFGVTSVSGPELRDEVDPSQPLNQGKMTAEQLTVAIEVARSRGERIVFTNGCFDILHSGHVDYLTEARREGDRLVVAINSDESVHRLKGEGRPINTLERRMTMLAGLTCVDWVVAFDEDTPESLLQQILPDVLVKGGDYAIEQVVGADIVRQAGGQVQVLSLVEDCSTSAIVEKIRDL